jgi:hypothetical protein
MRRRGPGLVGMAARTAVVAGTATAVSGRVARRQAGKAQAEQAQAAPTTEEAGVPETAEPAPAQDDTVAQLQQLAALRDQGILTEEEFTAKKQQILGI